MQNESSELSFLAGGGEMGRRVATFDWACTPLGPIAEWSSALRVATGMVLSSRFPCCLVWGKELITLYNDAFRPILGTKPEALGRPFSDVWSEAWPMIGPIADRAFAGEATFIEDYSLVLQRSGQAEEATFTFCYSPVRDEHGVVVGMIDTVIETTSRILAERAQAEALRQTEDNLRQSQKMEAIGQLAGGLAHDFNNLLMGIAGSLELLNLRLSQHRLGELERHIDTARRNTDRAAALTQRLLVFARNQPLNPQAVDINQLVRGMDDLVRRSVGPRIIVDLDCEPNLWPAWVDPHQVENALLNLCLNARDAMAGQGRLGIETAKVTLADAQAHERGLPAGDYLRLTVTDTGCGMTPQTVDRIFEPFFTTKSAGQGTGLGLSLLYGFVRQSGGQVQVTSRPGMGTAMSLYFPRGESALAPIEPGVPRHTPRAASGLTVLVAEDDVAVMAVVSETLSELGYIVLSAVDGASALRLLSAPAPIHLLICDIGLPGGMDGRQVADAGRMLRPDLKVLFITGSGARAGDEPGAPTLPKPFSLDELARQVHALIPA
jgi:signal transduction histidine kinase/CheY-like chemotaxis protein